MYRYKKIKMCAVVILPILCDVKLSLSPFKIFQNRLLRGLSGPRRKEFTGG
jgi:hypothetical protein